MTLQKRISAGYFVALWLVASGTVGCAATAPEAERPIAPQESPGRALFSQGKFFAARGESVRAEQYFLAAGQQGVPREEVFSALLQSCVESGRLRSALHHVEEEMRLDSDEAGLLQLAASLSWALDHKRAAFGFVSRLEQVAARRRPSLLFLAEFYEAHAVDLERSVSYYRAALQLSPEAADARWVQSNVNRLEHRIEEDRLVQVSQGAKND